MHYSPYSLSANLPARRCGFPVSCPDDGTATVKVGIIPV